MNSNKKKDPVTDRSAIVKDVSLKFLIAAIFKWTALLLMIIWIVQGCVVIFK